MTLLELLAAADVPVVADLTAGTVADTAAAKFDNRPTWDNAGSSFDNRPTWDNWSKKSKK
ncbi:multiple cyclophane-containing RiPP AmcA [Kitasatospora sp. NPDC093806]|uniref:multiple cyclophane-containing RiPP AmcA n=1 Tax=Kitasatospora sp. NPDC093806 TaxID=3155075 RepID=UPI0034434341